MLEFIDLEIDNIQYKINPKQIAFMRQIEDFSDGFSVFTEITFSGGTVLKIEGTNADFLLKLG